MRWRKKTETVLTEQIIIAIAKEQKKSSETDVDELLIHVLQRVDDGKKIAKISGNRELAQKATQMTCKRAKKVGSRRFFLGRFFSVFLCLDRARVSFNGS